MGEIDNIICTINPGRYAEGTRANVQKFKSIIKKQGFDEGLKSMKDLGIKPKPSADHQLIYNSTSETLEPVYFWLLDFMNQVFGGNVEKIMDNFASSPGSGHFSELQGKATQMQQEASRVLGTVNNILKGVLNLIYDLKEFKIRLSHYDAAKSSDKTKSEAGLLALKQMWMDKVDIQRGQGSINAMTSGNLNFVTLRDAFLIAPSVKSVDSMDLNERVKRILKPRLQEFFEWRKRSEQELRKRFEIEKIYLKSQTAALKLNARWAKPYLKAAQQLAQSERLASQPELVNIFNTVFMELILKAKITVDVKQEVTDKNLPYNFKKMKKLRKYSSIVFAEFKFRGIPGKAGQHYVFGGRADVTFKAYALSEQEEKLLMKKLGESDLEDSLKLIQGMTDDSLQELKLDLKELLEDSDEEEKEKINQENTNPFSALFGFLKPSTSKPGKKKDKEDKEKQEIELFKTKGIKKDNYAEEYVRNIAEATAINRCYFVFDIYKKAHGMASLPYMEDVEAKAPKSKVEDVFGFEKEPYG
tara:strand:- start:5110 stop:6696 length:1587 start_codon:yes stop_codon:yes gene_type:complete